MAAPQIPGIPPCGGDTDAQLTGEQTVRMGAGEKKKRKILKILMAVSS